MALKNTETALVVLEGFVGKVGDEERMFRTGDLIRPDDPAVKKWPQMFGSARYQHDKVEHATSAPGETR